METTSITNKPRIYSWLGFWFSIAFLVLIWTINIILLRYFELSESLFETLRLLFIAGGLCGITGLIFSIIGLTSSIRNSYNKLPSILGIVIVFVSVISISVTFICLRQALSREVVKIQLPNIDDNSYQRQESGIVIYIEKDGELKLYRPDQENPIVINEDQEEALKSQLEALDYDTETTIKIQCDRECGFATITNLLDILDHIGIRHYYIATHAPVENDSDD